MTLKGNFFASAFWSCFFRATFLRWQSKLAVKSGHKPFIFLKNRQCMAKAIEMLALWLSDLPAMQTVSEMRPQSPISKLLTRFELSNQAGFCIISRIIQLLRKFMESIDSINRFASNT